MTTELLSQSVQSGMMAVQLIFTSSDDRVTITGHNYSYRDEIGFAGITGGIGLGDGENILRLK